MDRGRPIASPKGRAHRSTSRPHQQMLSSSPLAEQALADDIAACSEDDAVHPEDDDFCDAGFPTHGHGMYRRPSGVAYGGARPVFN